MGTTTLDPKNAEAAIQYVSPTDTSVSTGNWSKALLTLIGAPVNDSNVANIQTWLAHEQNPTSWAKGALGESAQQIQSNPLGVGGAGNHPGSIYEGLLQTAETLLTNPSYGLIVGSLQSNTSTQSAPTQSFATAVVTSPWQSGNTTSGSYGKDVSSFLSRGQLEVTTEGLLGTVINYVDGKAEGFSYSNGAKAVANTAKDVAAPITTVAGLIGDITNPTKLKNVGIFLLGGAIATAGLFIFFAATKPGQDVGHAAKDGAMVAA